MYCKKCGKYLEEEQKFCSNCGEKVVGVNSKNKRIIVVLMIMVVVICISVFLIGNITENGKGSDDTHMSNSDSLKNSEELKNGYGTEEENIEEKDAIVNIQITEEYNVESGEVVSQTETQYDEKGREINIKYSNIDGVNNYETIEWEDYDGYAIGYYDNGNCIEQTYDEVGNILCEKMYYGEKKELYMITENQYKDDKVVEKKITYVRNNFEDIEKYNENETLIERISIREGKTTRRVWIFSMDGKIQGEQRIDENDCVVEEWIYVAEYNSYGDMKKVDIKNIDGSFFAGVEFEYDENQNLIELRQYHSDGNLLYRTTWTYY